MKKTASFLLLLLFTLAGFCQQLPRSTPETEGVSSDAIINFINSYRKDKHELHSVMIIRHGKVIAEGWWSPYSATMKHSMYSVSKSWTSTAIGFAVDEKKLAVTDKVISFFPEYKDLADKPYIQDLTIKDLLTMSVGHEKDQSLKVFGSAVWARGFFEAPIAKQPGTTFLYNTPGSYMLSAIITKVTGLSVLDYLKPRLFEPLGITGVDWESNMQGVNAGGVGFRDKTEDMAKLGMTYLYKGKFNGKQVLSEAWVNEATSKQILQNAAATQVQRDSSDWLQGYGYQFWRCRHNAFRADGAFGQYIVMMPEQDAIVVITSESLDLQDDLNMIWRNLLPAFEAAPLAPNPQAETKLKQFLSVLHLDAPASAIKSGDKALLNHVFNLPANEFNFASLKVSGKKKNLSLTIITTDKKEHTIPLGFNRFNFSETDLNGPNLFRKAPVQFNLMAPYKLASSFRWTDLQTLEITVRYIESPHRWTFTMHMENGKMKLKLVTSYMPDNVIDVTAQ